MRLESRSTPSDGATQRSQGNGPAMAVDPKSTSAVTEGGATMGGPARCQQRGAAEGSSAAADLGSSHVQSAQRRREEEALGSNPGEQHEPSCSMTC